MKLPILLKALQPEEHKDFKKFLQSPVFKASEQYLKYFNDLCKHHPDGQMDKADLQAAYERCFGAKAFNDTKFHNLTSGLGKQIEQFFVLRMVVSPDDKQNALYDELLVKALGKRNMGTYFQKEAQALTEEINESLLLTTDNFLALHQLYQEIYFNPDTPKAKDRPSYISLAEEYLDLFYFSSKLRYAAEMKTRERIYHFQYKYPMLEPVLDYCKTPEILEAHPLISIYFHLVQFYQQGVDEAAFRTLLKLFHDRFEELSPVDRITLLPHLINCGSSLLKEDISVEQELFTLYKMELDSGAILVGKRITHITFINIIGLACTNGALVWAKEFIRQFEPNLEERIRLPTVSLANACLHYEEGSLDEAHSCLIPEIFQVSLLDLIGRRMLVRIFFDRFYPAGKDRDFLLDQIDSMERYIRNQSISVRKQNSELNWVKFVRKMVNAKPDNARIPEAQKIKLKEFLKDLKPVTQKRWLYDKIDLL